jgi:molybdate transport system substrate-binding protein
VRPFPSSLRLPRRRLAAASAAGSLCAALALAGCGTSSAPAATALAGGGSPAAAVTGTINVFAAASLTEAFTTLGKQFEAAHPGVKVVFNFAASSDLATQITQAAPADVFASASAKNMAQVTSAGYASDPTTFANNTMEIATPPTNPASVSTVADLGKASTKIAVCQPLVPCGSTAAKVFTNANVTVKPVTLEPDVKSVLAKVELGEVDAGVVYVTDVRAAGAKVLGVVIPADVNASTSYPIAALTKSTNPTTARAFVAYVLSDAGASVLTADGFAKP